MQILNFVKGDIVESDATIIIQQCNCFATQGAGLAKQLVKKWPSVLQVDKDYPMYPIGDKERLGWFSIAEVEPKKYVINMYSQYKYGRGKCHTDYEAMEHALTYIVIQFTHMNLDNIKFAIPYGLGSGLAGGDWNKVLGIVSKVFAGKNWPVYIYSLKDVPELEYFKIVNEYTEYAKELGIQQGPFASTIKKENTMKLIKFAGHHGDDNSKAVFSNWYPSPFYTDENHDVPIRNVEEYMMLMKAGLFKDKEAILKIRKASTPKEFKAIGRTVKNFDSKIWDENKEQIVLNGLLMKFDQNPKLKATLMKHYELGAVFVECAPWDKIWGIGLSADDPRSDDFKQWKGQNLLGKCLTEVALTYHKEQYKEEDEMVDFDKLRHRITYYTDGSFSPKVNPDKSGWGFVAVQYNEQIGGGYGPSQAEGKHVTGEMMAVMQACIHALKCGFKEITLVHDNEGVFNWVDINGKAWKTNNERTKGYQKFMYEKIFPQLKVHFQWTKAHNGNEWNELADDYAKRGRTSIQNYTFRIPEEELKNNG